MLSDVVIISQTEAWVQRLIVKYNICPFARKELEQQTVRYVVFNDTQFEATLDKLINECRYLDENPGTETTLLILPTFKNFDDFLDLIAVAERLLAMSSYEGVYQLAHFHPDYCFEGEAVDDPANYTNRSPHPTLHILREESMAQALAQTDSPEAIPERNIEFARRKGAQFFEAILKDIV
ncbi:hypothetical protein DEU29_11111 [Idiomarina aquatica]|uniref:DUF1415 family protein n=1 Tax=Idiomarina aquatica TaxID=1327752 RepID=A0A4R6P3D9_9GAMM|nr:hypothetical protein DEU29_11111 [Idiomarina aquatica]